ncbi:hypothetical protein C0033_12025 [Clostridium sp. chh4-2]|uniref:hypothetical protein n=1 Tax=Clostridium sp. chh4-2 TaxID=2067550 RepID=UPI000CCE1678|nr:hypothetical protein [Clostridium sp. chh4-2]PNV61964.1 hypothetical protein C0033_12025 [Clostridium sp. chh4-2]
MKKVLIAGGLCGTTMLTAADKIKERCLTRNQEIHVKIQNLWETSYVTPGYDLIIEMFPFFEEEKCPVISGKPFISHIGEKALIEQIVNHLEE